ncbi:hypothetical protein [Cohnella soli]|uniref:VCBS repeat-containing protein n=1 Tax=Cohnella soli TaxID=425005 RepID=A0ABW0I1J7_9BACL
MQENRKRDKERHVGEKSKSSSKRRARVLWVPLAAACCVLLLIWLWPSQKAEAPDDNLPSASVPRSSEETGINAPDLAATPSLHDMIALGSGEKAVSPDVYPIEVNRIVGAKIAKSSVHVQKKRDTGVFGTIDLYFKKDDNDRLFAGLETGSTDLYEFGAVGEAAYLNEISITKSDWRGRAGLRISGACGASCVMNSWIHFEPGMPGVPISDFRLNAHVQEVDLDGDGSTEIVAAESYIAGHTLLFRQAENDVLFYDLTALISKKIPNTYIYYEGQQNIFKVVNGSLTYEYRYLQKDGVTLERVYPEARTVQ